LQSLDKRQGQVGVGWAKLEGRGSRRSGGTCRSSLPQLVCDWTDPLQGSALWGSKNRTGCRLHHSPSTLTGASASRGGRGSQSKRACPRNVSAGSRQTGEREGSRQHANETRRAHTRHHSVDSTPSVHPVHSTIRDVATTHEKGQTSHISTIGLCRRPFKTHTHTHT